MKTRLWALALITAFGAMGLCADSLTLGTYETVRNGQAQSITDVSLDLRQNRGGIGGPETILLQSSSAVNFSGMSYSNVVVELQRRAFEAALGSFTNNTDPNADFSVYLVARNTSTNGSYHEVATIYVGYRLAPNGSGGWTFSDPVNDTQEKLPVDFAKHLVVARPLRFYTGTNVFLGITTPINNPNAAKINLEDSAGNTIQVLEPRSRAGSYQLYDLTLGDTEFGIYRESGRVAFPITSLTTNGTLGKVNLEYSDGGVVRTRVFLLSNGLWLVAELKWALSQPGGNGFENLVIGQSGELVHVLETSSLSAPIVWTKVGSITLTNSVTSYPFAPSGSQLFRRFCYW